MVRVSEPLAVADAPVLVEVAAPLIAAGKALAEQPIADLVDGLRAELTAISRIPEVKAATRELEGLDSVVRRVIDAYETALAACNPVFLALPKMARALLLNEWQRRDCSESPWIGAMQLRCDRTDGPDRWSVSSTDDAIRLEHEKNYFVRDVGVTDKRQREANLAMLEREIKSQENSIAQYQEDYGMEPTAAQLESVKRLRDEAATERERLAACDEMIASYKVTRYTFDRALENGKIECP